MHLSTNVISKRKIIAGTVLTLGIILSLTLYFGVFDSIFLRHSFEKAFFYRSVGNCEAFINYVAVSREEWLARCKDEKEIGGIPPVQEFKILRINIIHSQNKAYIQASITRDKKYPINYEMIKDGFTWKISTEIK